MAVIVADSLNVGAYTGVNSYGGDWYAPTIDQPAGDDIAQIEYSASDFLSVDTLTRTTSTETPAQRGITADFANNFFADYYNRVHVIPNKIILGILVDVVTETFYIWNAWLLSSKTLTTVDTDGVGGMSLIGLSAPISFLPLEEKEYALQVELSGPIIIDAEYTFNFAAEAPKLIITGQRLLVWGYCPLYQGFSEELEWKTDVLKTYDAENRIALRTRPRTKFHYSYILNENEYSIAKISSEAWNANTFGVPVWSEVYDYGVIASGGYTLTFDTTAYEYYVGGFVFIFESNSYYQTLEIDSMTDSSLTFAYEINAFNDANVMPLRKALTISGTKIKRITPKKVFMESVFLTVNDNLIDTAIGSGVNYPQYLSNDVVTSRQIIISDFTEQTRYNLESFDNGSGAVIVEKINLDPVITQQITLYGITATEKWNNKVWLYSRYGKQKSFWVLSWAEDIIPTKIIVASEKSIQCEHIKYNLYKTVTYIAIILLDGTFIFNTITSGAELSSTEEVLALENTLPYDIATSLIDRICFMKKMRFDSDTIKLDHSNYPATLTKIPVTEVPE